MVSEPLTERWSQWQQRREEQAEAARYKKRKEIEEKKREQEIQEWDDHLQGKGYKNRAKTGVDKEREALEQQAKVKGKKGFKQDNYNPLMGMGGGSGYRPAPRR